jgi:hypothetical protein
MSTPEIFMMKRALGLEKIQIGWSHTVLPRARCAARLSRSAWQGQAPANPPRTRNPVAAAATVC